MVLMCGAPVVLAVQVREDLAEHAGGTNQNDHGEAFAEHGKDADDDQSVQE